MDYEGPSDNTYSLETAVYITHDLMKFVKRLNTNSKLGIFLRIEKEVFCLTQNIIRVKSSIRLK